MKLLYAGLICLLLAVPCAARIITVDDDGPADFSTVQAAIDDASDGDKVIVADGTYTGTGNWDIDFKGKAITLRSQNDPDKCIIDCASTWRVPHRGFYFHSGESAKSVVDGFTITGGAHMYGAGIYCSKSSPTIRNSVISGNTAKGWIIGPDPEGYGGGVFCSVASPTITDCIITNNYAETSGGGLFFDPNSSPVVQNCTISVNKISEMWWSEAAAIYNKGCMKLVNCTIGYHNTVRGKFNIRNLGANVLIQNCTFVENQDVSGGGRGGAIYNENSKLFLTDCIFKSNKIILGNGGAMYNRNSDVRLTKCMLVGNSGYVGGAMYNESGSITLTACIFVGNSAVEKGGAIYNYNSNPTLINCTFSGNIISWITPWCGGGALYNDNSKPTLANCILWGDTPDEILDRSGMSIVTYSNVQGGWQGKGNIDSDPCFAEPGHWDSYETPDNVSDDFWIDGDYHLKSQAGQQPKLGQRRCYKPLY